MYCLKCEVSLCCHANRNSFTAFHTEYNEKVVNLPAYSMLHSDVSQSECDVDDQESDVDNLDNEHNDTESDPSDLESDPEYIQEK